VLYQWIETDKRVWNGLAPRITVLFEQEIGFVRSIKFDVNLRKQGLEISDAWGILRMVPPPSPTPLPLHKNTSRRFLIVCMLALSQALYLAVSGKKS